MFDPDLLKEYPEDQIDQINLAVMNLAASAILIKQIEREMRQLIDGSSDDSELEVAKQILRFRAETKGLQLIHDYGLTLLMETQNA